jgi:hypothetical protein
MIDKIHEEFILGGVDDKFIKIEALVKNGETQINYLIIGEDGIS